MARSTPQTVPEFEECPAETLYKSRVRIDEGPWTEWDREIAVCAFPEPVGALFWSSDSSKPTFPYQLVQQVTVTIPKRLCDRNDIRVLKPSLEVVVEHNSRYLIKRLIGIVKTVIDMPGPVVTFELHQGRTEYISR